MEYRYYFDSRMKAQDAFDQIKHIAELYGVVTVDDANEICELYSSYVDTKYGWLEDSLKKASIERMSYCYALTLPRPVAIAADATKISHHEVYDNSTVEPLCITIHTKDVDDVDATLAETFKYIYTIKDRMVNLTIM